jgi:hypothetical protein
VFMKIFGAKCHGGVSRSLARRLTQDQERFSRSDYRDSYGAVECDSDERWKAHLLEVLNEEMLLAICGFEDTLWLQV